MVPIAVVIARQPECGRQGLGRRGIVVGHGGSKARHDESGSRRGSDSVSYRGGVGEGDGVGDATRGGVATRRRIGDTWALRSISPPRPLRCAAMRLAGDGAAGVLLGLRTGAGPARDQQERARVEWATVGIAGDGTAMFPGCRLDVAEGQRKERKRQRDGQRRSNL